MIQSISKSAFSGGEVGNDSNFEVVCLSFTGVRSTKILSLLSNKLIIDERLSFMPIVPFSAGDRVI